MWSKQVLSFVMCLFVMLLSGIVFTSKASGGLILNVGVKGTYEDNISGSDVDKQGDFYTTLSASVGGYTKVADETFLFLRGDIANYLYSKYDDRNASIFGVSAGLHKKLGDALSAQIAIKSKLKEFNEEPRDSSSLGGTFELKQQLTPKFWIKEGYEYENNNANSAFFNYRGHSVGIWSGYMISPETMLNIGYSYFTCKYEDASGFRTKSNTISVGAVRELVKKVYLNLGYDRQFTVSNTDYNNNIYTVSVTYSF